jgi:hypothetical protein
MNRFSLQNVKDAEINRALRQVQDALNTLSDNHTSLKTIVTSVQKSTTSTINIPTKVALNKMIIASNLSNLRVNLIADTWTSFLFPEHETTRPNYVIVCRNESDPNRDIYYELRNVTDSGFDIKTTESCSMELNTFKVEG